VSRYKFNRSQKTVTVQDYNCEQMRASGCIYHYKAILGAGAKAKSVTNNLPILSVLAFRCMDQIVTLPDLLYNGQTSRKS